MFIAEYDLRLRRETRIQIILQLHQILLRRPPLLFISYDVNRLIDLAVFSRHLCLGCTIPHVIFELLQ